MNFNISLIVYRYSLNRIILPVNMYMEVFNTHSLFGAYKLLKVSSNWKSIDNTENLTLKLAFCELEKVLTYILVA